MQRFFQRDQAVLVQAEQRLFESLRAFGHAGLDRFLDLVDLAVAYQVGNVRGVDQHLQRRAALAVAGGDQPLRDHRLQRGRQVH
ncbi:hypothetical protein D3C84_1171830 [compost metagenome]